MLFFRGAYSLSDNASHSEIDELLDSVSSPTLPSDRSSSQTTSDNGTSLNAVKQFKDLASIDDLPAISLNISEDEDDSNGHLQKQNLFQSLQHNPSHNSSDALSLFFSALLRPNNDSDIDEVLDSVSSPTLQSDRSSFQTTFNDGTSLNAVEQDPASIDDLPAIPLDFSEDEDDSNGHIQKQNLFQSLQHNPSHISDDDALSLFFSSLLRPNKSMELKDTHLDNAIDFGQPVTSPKSPIDFPSVSSSKTTNGVSSTPKVKEMPELLSSSTSNNVEVVVEHFSSNSVSHHSHGMPMIQPCVTPSQPSVIHNEDNLDGQQNTSESKTNNRPDSTPITCTQPLPLTSKSLESDIAIVREISVPEDFATEKPSTSPNVQSPPLNSTTTDSNPPVREVEARLKWRSPLRSLQRIRVSSDSLPSDGFTPAPVDIVAQKMEELRRRIESHNLSAEGVWRPSLRSLQPISESGDLLPSGDFTLASDDKFTQRMEELRRGMESHTGNLSTEGVRPPERQKLEWRLPLRYLQRISVSGASLPSDDLAPAPDDNFTQKMEELRTGMESHTGNLSTEGARPPERQQWRPSLRSLRHISVAGDSLLSNDFAPAPDDKFTQKMEELRKGMESRTGKLSIEASEGVRSPEGQQWEPPLRSLQCISDSGDSLSSNDFATAPNDTFVQKMKELQRRRMELHSLMAQATGRTSPGTLSSRTTATLKAELRAQLQTLQEDHSSDVALLVKYINWKRELQTQLDKALAELRDVQAENKHLDSENESQQRSISHLKIALDKAKHNQDNNSIRLDKALAKLRDVQAENKHLNSVNESQQRSVSDLKVALDEAKHERDNNSTRLEKALTELRDARTENESQQRSVSDFRIALDEARHERDNNSTQLGRALAELRDVQAENESQQRSVSYLKIALDEAKDNNSTRLDKALAELRDAQAENESQQSSVSDLKVALDEAKHERDNNSTRLDRALAELGDVQAENKHLNSENESQQRSVSDLKIALDEAKHEQDNNSIRLDKALAKLRDVQAENEHLNSENASQQCSISHLKSALDEQDNSSIQTNKQLGAASTSLALLNKEKKGWQDKLDSLQHKLNAAERQVRCLDHLTRQKVESRQDASYGQPRRRGLFASNSSIPAIADVIGAMRGLNEKIYQTCVQFAGGLEGTAVTVFPTKQKPQVQKVLGDHLTAMIEDHAKKARATSSYNMLLMQTVLEVFMTHWCSSIIEAFYPPQESFSDLLVQLSAQATETSGLTAICGKQIKIIQSSTHDESVKFNEWVKEIRDELRLLLTMAGLRMKTPLFSTKTLALVKFAYGLRTSMAEKDICGGLEIIIVPPDTPFQEKWMMDAHADPAEVDTDQSRVDFVAGTTGIGLQRKVMERVNGQFQSRMEIELKPKVTLVRALNT